MQTLAEALHLKKHLDNLLNADFWNHFHAPFFTAPVLTPKTRASSNWLLMLSCCQYESDRLFVQFVGLQYNIRYKKPGTWLVASNQRPGAKASYSKLSHRYPGDVQLRIHLRAKVSTPKG
uniref:Uncharacterized protein n=1 Tax=Dunaliella tertiolecta TaxID=3047 RepID=A0A7S3R6H5_DUNTE|mmetsp:Transcript_25365/g.65350  ORF Transcript_25365/g.65350 Transcript_25365/m.65350 type:complete len:120 (-) Transcript_25365:537-896(-)